MFGTDIWGLEGLVKMIMVMAIMGWLFWLMLKQALIPNRR